MGRLSAWPLPSPFLPSPLPGGSAGSTSCLGSRGTLGNFLQVLHQNQLLPSDTMSLCKQPTENREHTTANKQTPNTLQLTSKQLIHYSQLQTANTPQLTSKQLTHNTVLPTQCYFLPLPHCPSPSPHPHHVLLLLPLFLPLSPPRPAQPPPTCLTCSCSSFCSSCLHFLLQNRKESS